MIDSSQPVVSAELLAELRNNLTSLSGVNVAAEPHWAERCLSLARDAWKCDPESFLLWPSLEDMSVSEVYPDIFAWCQQELRHHQSWNERWYFLSREDRFGNPKPLFGDSGTSPILLQHTYHLFLYETITNRSIVDGDVIVEFGGGFGSFCRLARKAGFRGLYIIFDLPHISAIQRFYLKSLGFVEASRPEALANPDGKFWLVNHHELEHLVEVLMSHRRGASCVATWSLSEFPLSVRNSLFPRLHPVFSQYLISFQPEWGSVNNTAYFRDFARQRGGENWHRFAIPGSEYLLL